jgi:cobalamin biosynthesis Mg chelatase CobN
MLGGGLDHLEEEGLDGYTALAQLRDERRRRLRVTLLAELCELKRVDEQRADLRRTVAQIHGSHLPSGPGGAVARCDRAWATGKTGQSWNHFRKKQFQQRLAGLIRRTGLP